MSSKQAREPWRNAERYYCAICNAWMGSDRQSIIIHENGKKHIEKLKENLKLRQQNKLKQERQKTELEKSLLKIEKIANLKHADDLKFFGGGNKAHQGTIGSSPFVSDTSVTTASAVSGTSHMTSPFVTPKINESKQNKKQKSQADKMISKKEMESWNDRKKRRNSSRSNEEDENAAIEQKHGKTEQRVLGENEGHYTIDERIYLEGKTYASLFIEDMPIEIWTGSRKANGIDFKKYENQSYWKTGLICKIYNHSPEINQENENGITGTTEEAVKICCDVAYLHNPTDRDETFERKVPANRLRILVGSGNDSEDGVPNSLEEARLELLGGEEKIILKNNQTTNVEGGFEKEQVRDENTGFTGWNTVSIRKVTMKKELKEEVARNKAKRKFERDLKEKNQKDIEERKMEEAKYANADDSALGAYDIWGVTAKSNGYSGGYKGVDIHSESKIDHVAEAVSKLSKDGGSTSFKKTKKGSSFNSKALKKKKFRRITSADD